MSNTLLLKNIFCCVLIFLVTACGGSGSDSTPEPQKILLDTDGDGISDEDDSDIDGDGVLNVDDAFPLDSTESVDTDGDGIGNNSDQDIDGDGVLNDADAFPSDVTESVDTDGDGIGNNSDQDIDGDGVLNANDPLPFDATLVEEPTAIINARSMIDHADAWWRWTRTMASEYSPVLDETGYMCNVHQEGRSVWYLAGGYGDSKIIRNCQVPKGKHLFFPIITKIIWSASSCESAKEEIKLKDDNLTFIEVIIDGKQVENIRSFNFTTEKCFDFNGDIRSDLNFPDLSPSASSGYWLMVKPLSVGEHKITFKANYTGAEEADNLSQDIEYNLTIIDGTINDLDSDFDGTKNTNDAFPFDASEQVDTDGDGAGNNADIDDDNDGVIDGQDVFPLRANESKDSDDDSLGDNQDNNDDNDSYLDFQDDFPLDKLAHTDTDQDGMPDSWEQTYLLNIHSDLDALIDSDNDTFTNLDEYKQGSNPLDTDSIPTYVGDKTYTLINGDFPRNSKVFSERGGWSLNTEYADLGFLLTSNNGYFEFSDYFHGNTLDFKVLTDYSFDIYIDGEKVKKQSDNNEWQNISIIIPRGFHTIRIENSASTFFALTYFKFEKLKPIIELDVRHVGIDYNTLRFWDHSGLIAREVLIPIIENVYVGNEDIKVLSDNRIAIFRSSSTSTSMLSIYNPELLTWQHLSLDFIHVDTSAALGFTYKDDYLYFSDHATTDNPVNGIVRYNLNLGTSERFSDKDYTDLSIGNNNELYALHKYGVDVFDLSTLALTRTLTFNLSSLDGYVGLTVDAKNNIYLLNSSGLLTKYLSSGELLTSKDLKLDVKGSFYRKITINRDNTQLLVTNSSKAVAFLDKDLNILDKLDDHASEGAFFADFVKSSDYDQDGIPTWWENKYGYSDYDATDSLLDEDNDQANTLTEYLHNTLPNNTDTDGDGVTDGYEIHTSNSSALLIDTDEDGLTDGQEINELNTNPLTVDSDNDGLLDFDEVTTLFSDPLSSDSDQDGMDDFYEVNNNLLINVDDSLLDLDADGLINKYEYITTSNPNVKDSDNDGLLDGEEVHTYSTNPVSVDSDQDKIADGWEVIYSLNPTDISDGIQDLDGDGYLNFEEYHLNSDPNNANDMPKAKPWITIQANAAHTSFIASNLQANSITEVWRKDLSRVMHNLIAANGKVFLSDRTFGYRNHIVQALNQADGAETWSILTAADTRVSSLTYANEQLYFSSNDALQKVYANNGEQIFKSEYKYPHPDDKAPTVFEDKIYVAGINSYGIQAFNDNGVLDYRSYFSHSDKRSPTVDKEYIYFYETSSEMLYAYNRINGSYAYKINNHHEGMNGQSKLAQDMIGKFSSLIIANGENLVIFDTHTKKVRWADIGKHYGQLATAYGDIYSIKENALQVFDELSGENVWSFSLADTELTSNIVVTRNLVFIGNETYTYAIDLNTHLQVWSTATGGDLVLSENMLYIQSDSQIVAFSVTEIE